jgi:nicotinamide riboside kinase
MEINSPPEIKRFTLTIMAQINELGKFRVPIGNQEVELQQIDHVDGGMSMLRTRIREAKRFTIFDVDPITARHWAKLMLEWADSQEQSTK